MVINIWLKRVGVLRGMLALIAIAIMFASRFAGGDAVYTGAGAIPTLVFPAVAPIIFFVLLLDMLMAAVFMVEKQGEERARFRYIIRMDMWLTAGILLFWLPFFISLVSV